MLPVDVTINRTAAGATGNPFPTNPVAMLPVEVTVAEPGPKLAAAIPIAAKGTDGDVTSRGDRRCALATLKDPASIPTSPLEILPVEVTVAAQAQ